MLARFLIIFTIFALVTTVVWSKNKITPQSLMEKSDTMYYYPTAHGLTDMAVDLTVEQFAKNPATKPVTITFYYAGEKRQQFAISNLDEHLTELRDRIAGVVNPLADYLVPKTSQTTFKGLKLSTNQVYREFTGDPNTVFYQLVGVAPEKDAEVKEFRVLLDKDGLAHQVENILKDDSSVIARIENEKIGNQWHITRMTTRLMAGMNSEWKIDSVEYGMVDGYSLPVRATIQFRDNFNRPVKGADDLTILFTNYRINKGAAAAILPPAAPEAPKVETPAPASAPAKK